MSRYRFVSPLPNLGSKTVPFYLSSNGSSSIRTRRYKSPGGDGGVEELRMKKPRVFEEETVRRRYGCGGGGEKWEVVGGGAGSRGEGGVGEGNVPFFIEEDAV
jgi:hypothetical protein